MPKDEKRCIENWDELYTELEEYWEEYHQIPPTDNPLHKWAIQQRHLYRKGKLAQNRVDRILASEIPFMLFAVQEKNKNSDDYWNKMEQLTKEFVTRRGRRPTARTEYKGERIGSWLHRECAKYYKGNLSHERGEILVRDGLLFKPYLPSLNPDGPQEKRWQEMYRYTCLFLQEFSKTPVAGETYAGEQVGRWLSNQWALYQKGTMNADRAEKLIDAGLFNRFF